ncbi:uncharacterized protein B0J16DRAFT_331533 [Fusarium flagelliforme]|uniref:uncharacterized protein n=1 Tax=Fusarium flagelliforme TaxID=2675880 RepID=UPI001E8DA88A|nr:uncharacterized protein B0J16DRAFT_331533 [Fusarium flagelliforme]KAH7199061.1 hypothetical protein B0J16DRAFT_331533 [Fusarium flagelliforme]
MAVAMSEYCRRLLWNSKSFIQLTRNAIVTSSPFWIPAAALIGNRSYVRTVARGSDSALSNRYEASASPFGLFTMQKGTRGTPTESEEDVVADRSTEDPLPPEKHHTIRLPAGGAQPRPTESEEDVVADRAEDDPLRPKDMARNKTN